MLIIFPGMGCIYLSIDGDTLVLYFSKNFTPVKMLWFQVRETYAFGYSYTYCWFLKYLEIRTVTSEMAFLETWRPKWKELSIQLIAEIYKRKIMYNQPGSHRMSLKLRHKLSW